MGIGLDVVSRIEWFEGPDQGREPEVEAPARPQTRVSRIIECQTCGWHEAETAAACFRCGEALAKGTENDPTLQRLGLSVGGAMFKVDARLPASRTPILVDNAASHLLRVRAESLRLVQGFEELISLDQVRVDQYEYQLEACRRVLTKMRGRALLADEVGLGKTIEAGLVMKELLLRHMAKRVLVLTPASLTYQWCEELQVKFGESFEVVTHESQWGPILEKERARVIVSLDRAKGARHAPMIHGVSWDLLIIDEGHRLKNRSTKAYGFVKEIERRYMLMLTATPVHNDLGELYSLIDLLKPGQLGTIRSFREQFVKSGDPRSPENATALQQLLGDVMIRNRRGEVDVTFPQRKAAVLHLKLPELERRLYDDMSRFMRESLRQRGAQRHLRLGLMTLQRELCSSPAAVASTLRKMAEKEGYEAEFRARALEIAARAEGIGYPVKVDAVLEVLESYEGKVLIFTEFRHTQRELVKALRESGISVVGFHGQLNSKEKEAAVQSFKRDVRVMVSTESGGEGRNLQFCHQLINYDLPWNPMRVEQRIGRLHRLGQKNEVVVFNLCTDDTLEAYLLDLLVKKIRMFELVVGELDLIIGDVERPGEVKSFEDMITQAWLGSEDDIDLQVELEQIGERFSQSRSRYLDRRVLNEEMFDNLRSGEGE